MVWVVQPQQVQRHSFQRPLSQPEAKTNPISASNRSKGAQSKLLVKGGKGRKGQNNVRIRERWEAGSEDEDDEEDDKVVAIKFIFDSLRS